MMLSLVNIKKSFKRFSLENVNLEVPKGAYFMLIGSSGAGKTLLLEIISGLCTPDGGDLYINANRINDIPIQNRKIGLVYQSQTLFPHLSVFENIAYPLRCKRLKRGEIKERVEQIAQETEVFHLLSRGVTMLSGGEIQRVTIARALVSKPEILLLDEPLSSLDVQLKRGIMALLRKLHQQGLTIVHVTHDYEEALSLADTVGILENGTIIQTGPLKAVLKSPKSQFVASFVGLRNFFPAKVAEKTDETQLKVVESNGLKFYLYTDAALQTKGFLIIDANSVTVSPQRLDSSAVNSFKGIVKEVLTTRNGVEICVDIGVEIFVHITMLSFEKFGFGIGSTIWISFKATEVRFSEG